MTNAVPAFVCALLTAGCLGFVFYPPRHLEEAHDKSRLTFLQERKTTVYDNLRDLNFEYKAGKYPEADYQSMRTSLEEEAAALLAEIERLERRTQA